MRFVLREHELAWSLRGKMPSFRWLVNQTIGYIEEALTTTSFLVSWSAGKDSTALVHLILSVAPTTPIIIQFDDCDWPEKEPYADRIVTALGWTVHKVRPDFSTWGMAQKLRLGDEEICSQGHRLTRDGFLKPLIAKRHELGCNGVFLGLRMEESKVRKRNLESRGHLYQLKDSSWRSNPLWKWRTEDVFAYLIINKIEINPCYFHNRFLTPEKIRLSWALPTPLGLATGTVEHIRYYYPEQFRRLRDLGVV